MAQEDLSPFDGLGYGEQGNTIHEWLSQSLGTFLLFASQKLHLVAQVGADEKEQEGKVGSRSSLYENT